MDRLNLLMGRMDALASLGGRQRSARVQLLGRMTAGEWARQAWHTEGGPYGPERWLEIYALHAHNHAAQITRLRAAVMAEARGTRQKRASSR